MTFDFDISRVDCINYNDETKARFQQKHKQRTFVAKETFSNHGWESSSISGFKTSLQ